MGESSAGVGGSGWVGSRATGSSSSGTTTTGGSNTSGACAVTPTETIGPYPSLTNFVRSDIREGRSGLPLTLTITIVNSNSSCSPVANAADTALSTALDRSFAGFRARGLLVGVEAVEPVVPGPADEPLA